MTGQPAWARTPELFFPAGTTGPALDRTERAKAVCAACPVTARCLAYALASGQDHGIWGGGMDEEARRSVRRARSRRGRGPVAA